MCILGAAMASVLTGADVHSEWCSYKVFGIARGASQQTRRDCLLNHQERPVVKGKPQTLKGSSGLASQHRRRAMVIVKRKLNKHSVLLATEAVSQSLLISSIPCMLLQSRHAVEKSL